jgi:hypothetical protein
MRKQLAKVKFLKKTIQMIRRFKFELKCIIDDFFYIIKDYKNIKKNSADIVFVTSLDFYKNKKWQVATLWHSFVKENNAILCGSLISYKLFFRKKRYVVSLEPKYNAPSIKFSSSHKKAIIFLSDSHSKEWLPEYLKNNNITDILTPYKKTLLYTGYASLLNESNIHSFPWSVPSHLTDNITISLKNNEVLGFGQTGSIVYDLRDWSFNTGLLVTFDYAGSGNYKFKGDEYFRWLRENFDACVVAMSSEKLYNYTVAKFFEIPSQGLLLFAFPSVDLEDFGFVDEVNCIFVNKDNFHEKIEKYKENPQKYFEIRKNGLELIKLKHTVSERLKYLTTLIEVN